MAIERFWWCFVYFLHFFKSGVFSSFGASWQGWVGVMLKCLEPLVRLAATLTCVFDRTAISGLMGARVISLHAFAFTWLPGRPHFAVRCSQTKALFNGEASEVADCSLRFI
jgi:hypothetical protein